MILSSHSIIGSAFAGLLSTNPAVALTVGLGSHYLFDLIPHWDYTLGPQNYQEEEKPKLNLDFKSPTFKTDVIKISLDLVIGFSLSYFLFVRLAGFSWPIILMGIIGGLLPDFFQLIYSKLPTQPFIFFQQIHDFFHAEERPYKKAPINGSLRQLGLVIGIVGITFIFLKLLN